MAAIIAPKIENEQLTQVYIRLYYRGTATTQKSLADFKNQMERLANVFKEAVKNYSVTI